MQDDHPELPDGYSPVPTGKVANVVTFLEMWERPTGAANAPERP